MAFGLGRIAKHEPSAEEAAERGQHHEQPGAKRRVAGLEPSERRLAAWMGLGSIPGDPGERRDRSRLGGDIKSHRAQAGHHAHQARQAHEPHLPADALGAHMHELGDPSSQISAKPRRQSCFHEAIARACERAMAERRDEYNFPPPRGTIRRSVARRRDSRLDARKPGVMRPVRWQAPLLAGILAGIQLRPAYH